MQLLSLSSDCSVKIWDMASKSEIKNIILPNCSNYSRRAAAYNSDGTKLAYGTERTLNIVSSDMESADSPLNCDLLPRMSWIHSLCFNRAGDQLATGHEMGEIVIWDTGSGAIVQYHEISDATVSALNYSIDDRYIAFGGMGTDREVVLINTNSGTIAASLLGHTNWIRSIQFSPNEALLASCGDDCTIHCWDINTLSLLKVLRGHRNAVHCICFSPDGTKLASGADDHRVIVWDLESGNQLFDFDGHASWVYSVSYSSDGDSIATAGGSKNIIVLDSNSGAQMMKLEGHTNSIRTVCFAPIQYFDYLLK